MTSDEIIDVVKSAKKTWITVISASILSGGTFAGVNVIEFESRLTATEQYIQQSIDDKYDDDLSYAEFQIRRLETKKALGNFSKLDEIDLSHWKRMREDIINRRKRRLEQRG